MKQPLMLIPPAQAEVLSDNCWADAGREGTSGEDRFTSLRWLDDDLPEEAAPSSHAPSGDMSRRLSRPRLHAA